VIDRIRPRTAGKAHAIAHLPAQPANANAVSAAHAQDFDEGNVRARHRGERLDAAFTGLSAGAGDRIMRDT